MSQHRIFVLQPFRPEYQGVYEYIIQPTAIKEGASAFRADQILSTGMILEGIYRAIEDCSLVIADISGMNPNVMYELGFAHALRKPVILMVDNLTDQTPFDIAAVRILHYNTGLLGVEEAKGRLREAIREALANPEAFSTRPRTDTSRNTVFLSYSHTDRTYLERVLIHLKPLERGGFIDLWVDTRLQAGAKWKSEIDTALRQARAAVLLVSADFLASDFIVNNELPPLLEQAERRGTKIIPVILSPCRFSRDENLRAFQALNDPSRPIACLPKDEQESYFDKLSAHIERLFPPET